MNKVPYPILIILPLTALLISCGTTTRNQIAETVEEVAKRDVRVTGTQHQKGNVRKKALKGRLEQLPPLDVIGLPYQVLKSANVRGGPGTDFVIVDGIKQGETVKVIGKVIDANWFLIGNDELVNGFVYAPLLSEILSKSFAAAVESKGDRKTQDIGELEAKTGSGEHTCPSIQQKITSADGSTHEEEIEACKEPSGWIIKF